MYKSFVAYIKRAQRRASNGHTDDRNAKKSARIDCKSIAIVEAEDEEEAKATANKMQIKNKRSRHWRLRKMANRH